MKTQVYVNANKIMKLTQAKNIIRRILKEQAAKEKKQKFNTVDDVFKHLKSLNLDQKSMTQYIKKEYPEAYNSQGCPANPISEQKMIPSKGPDGEEGEEKIILAWLLFCAATIWGLNHWGSGQ